MKPWFNRCVRVSMASLLILGGASMACREDRSVAGPWVSWTTLRLEVDRAPLLSGSIELRIFEESQRTVVETRTAAMLLGARLSESSTRSTIDRDSGRSLDYVRRSRKRGRRYVFGERDYVVEKLRPTHGPDAPLDQWEVTSQRRFDYPEANDGGLFDVVDYYGMLLRLRGAALDEPGDEVTLHVATSDGPAAFRIRVRAERKAELTYVDLTESRQRTLTVDQLRLVVVPADPEKSGGGFLDMTGETELWVEKGSKTLLRLSGRVPKVPGRVELVLAGMG
jgi:hypothetical protein